MRWNASGSARLNNCPRVQRHQVTMGPLSWLAQNTGLITLTLLAVALTFYLLYAMIYPERF